MELSAVPVLHDAGDASRGDDGEAQESFAYSQLSKHAQARARDKVREYIEPDHGWWEAVYDDAVEVGKCLGIEIEHRWYNGKEHKPRIYFSGFSSQGDGACYTGRYRPRPDALEAVTEYAPQDERLKQFAARLVGMQVSAKLRWPLLEYDVQIRTDSSCYCHSGTMTFELNVSDGDPENNEGLGEWHQTHIEVLRGFADWIYAQLEAEYEYLTSDEQVLEQAAELRFDEDGSII
jgi:hypothetical protein